MSNRLRGYSKAKNNDINNHFDKHQEHMDQSPLGKIQQQYWTTKQQVIKKLGKKEDEFVVLSDAEVDAKLDLFEAIEQSSMDLLRIIEMYQDQIINLSIEESEMSTFLKSQSTYDTKTKAGKMMAAVSKAQHFAASHRNSLRLPLVRLYNEVETFRYRAISDTFLTVRKMENARTEYRGALLWMKNVSMEIDPDSSRKLEKFRRVQAQVKKTKTRFDRLKNDVTQKVDMLSASRCNMFSHVLVNYQRTFITFWTKTAKTFGAVAEAFKGYDHYEFNIIKDLVDPSKRMIDLQRREDPDPNDYSSLDKSVADTSEPSKETLINFDEQEEQKQISDFCNPLPTSEQKENSLQLPSSNIDSKSVDEVNELIDLMTLNEAGSLNEQLKELELLEQEKKQRNSKETNHTKGNNISKSDELKDKLSVFGAFISSAKSTSGSNDAAAAANLVDLDISLQQQAPYNSLKDILSNASDEFEREWQSAFITSNQIDSISNTNNNNNNGTNPPKSPDEFGQFTFSQISQSVSDTKSDSDSLLLNLSGSNINNYNNTSNMIQPMSNENILSPELTGDATATEAATSSKKIEDKSKNNNLSAWYDLFAELDPMKNPDAIGQQEGIEEERNC